MPRLDPRLRRHRCRTAWSAASIAPRLCRIAQEVERGSQDDGQRKRGDQPCHGLRIAHRSVCVPCPPTCGCHTSAVRPWPPRSVVRSNRRRFTQLSAATGDELCCAEHDADAHEGECHEDKKPEQEPCSWEPVEVGTGAFGNDEHSEQRCAAETPSPPVPG